jgi:hypothetical protein
MRLTKDEARRIAANIAKAAGVVAKGIDARQATAALCLKPTFNPPSHKTRYSSVCVMGVHSMEHQGVRYTIRAGIERDLWSVAIHPDGTESRARLIYGTREDAESEARSMINRWTERKPITRRRQPKPKAARDAERQ